MSTVICLGEIVIDWIRATVSGGGSNGDFVRHLAGVPANVAVALSRQGVKSAMVGRVGDDNLGLWAKDELAREGVSTAGVKVDSTAVTRVAYVERVDGGNRTTLSLTKENCADAKLAAADLDETHFQEASALYFGSTALSREPVTSAVAQALAWAKKHNLLAVCDANIWPAMWADDATCRATILAALEHIDVLKVNLDELEYLTGSSNLESAEELRRAKNLPMLVVTMDKRGAFVVTAEGSAMVPTFDVEVKEVAGAGDAFVGTLIASVLGHLGAGKNRRQSVAALPLVEVVNIVVRANAAGALVVARLGALCSMPMASEIDALMLAGFSSREPAFVSGITTEGTAKHE